MIEHEFAQYVRILGKGKKGSRSLNYEESYQAFTMILEGKVEDVQIGAFLMLLRVKEESAEEIAGFVQACKDYITPSKAIHVDIDWSSYAGKRKQLPWFILVLLVLKQQGHRVLVHGAKGHTAGRLYTEDAFAQLSLPIARSWDDIETALDQESICFTPIDFLCPPLHKLIEMRNLFGLRSPVHTLSRLINPFEAEHSFQSIFHPAYAETHQLAAQILKQPNMCVFKGESGEIERKSDATCLVKSLSNDVLSEEKWPRLQEAKQAPVETQGCDKLVKLWQGTEQDSYGENAVIGTLAICLKQIEAIDTQEAAWQRAEKLWQDRDKGLL